MVIPLAAAVLVCLLATSGVWLITAEKGDDEREATPIGLNVPTEAPGTNGTAADDPTAGGRGIQGEKPNQSSAGPTASATGSKSPTSSKSPTKPATSAPPSSAPPPPSSSAPPPPPPPPTTSAPPKPKEYAVTGSTTSTDFGWSTTVFVTVRVDNPGTTPQKPWRLSVEAPDGNFLRPSRVQGVDFDEWNVAVHETWQRPGAVEITFRIAFWDEVPASITYIFNDVRATVAVDGH
ncbi:hypothetical protein [Streptodolium elevatio]|uniref:CBM2 domain-containing protein n=1 Tax=Streptodolium elevatio TaxID=3157996 RepID=A0ABV3DJ99_9ACTN